MNWLEQTLQSEYETVAMLAPNKVRLRHRDLGQDLLKIETTADKAVYHRLMPMHHPNLAQIFDLFEQDGKLTVLEEFIDGTSVADLLTAGLFNEEGAKEICSALCDGLYALHLSGIIHRDIKPENVMIENGGRVVLIDFEAARIFKCGRSKDTQILGTAGYAAPEQFGINQTDERSDVYSLGILLNVLLTGCHPSVTLYGGRLGKVIERCTHIDPAKRFKNTAELKNFL